MSEVVFRWLTVVLGMRCTYVSQYSSISSAVTIGLPPSLQVIKLVVNNCEVLLTKRYIQDDFRVVGKNTLNLHYISLNGHNMIDYILYDYRLLYDSPQGYITN